MTEALLLLAGIALGAVGVGAARRRRVAPTILHPAPDRTGNAIDGTFAPGSTIEIVEKLPVGVLVLDEAMRPVFANWAACRLLDLQEGPLPSRLPSLDIAQAAARGAQINDQADQLVEIFYPRRMTLRVRSATLEAGGLAVCLQDATEEVRTQTVRREFVAHASHELKSPVASLQTLAEAIVQALPSDHDAALRFSGRLIDEASRLGKLVSDLLDLSRLEDRSRSPEKACDLTSLVRTEMEALTKASITAQHEITLDLPNEAWIVGDQAQIKLLIRNLLENAFEYTPSGGTVSTTLVQADGKAILKVSDTGVGIPLEAQGRVFERFYRVDRSRSRDKGGTGLGLAIVKHVVESHGGSVNLRSELGAGSTFTVSFPVITAKEAGNRSLPKDRYGSAKQEV